MPALPVPFAVAAPAGPDAVAERVPAPPPGLADALAGPVAAAVPAVAARIPAVPAAALGGLGAPPLPTDTRRAPGVDAFVAERLLRAVEPAVAINTPERARYGPHAAEFLEGVRERITRS